MAQLKLPFPDYEMEELELPAHMRKKAQKRFHRYKRVMKKPNWLVELEKADRDLGYKNPRHLGVKRGQPHYNRR